MKKNVTKCRSRSPGARIRCLVSMFGPGRGLSTLLTTVPEGGQILQFERIKSWNTNYQEVDRLAIYKHG